MLRRQNASDSSIDDQVWFIASKCDASIGKESHVSTAQSFRVFEVPTSRRPQPGLKLVGQLVPNQELRAGRPRRCTARLDLIARVKAEIAAGTYDTEQRLSHAIDAMLRGL